MEQKAKLSKQRKIALVLGGGGMRCAYVAGVLTALADHYKFNTPDIIIAESGSAASATYYATHQLKHATASWLLLSGDSRLISFFRWPILNIDYLVYHILRARYPFEEKALKKSRIKLLVPVTNASTGEIEYISPLPPNDVYQVLHAAKSIPILYNKTVRIKGETYYDGGFGGSVNDHINKAVELGATDVIVVRLQDGMSPLMRKIFEYSSFVWQPLYPTFYRTFRREATRNLPHIPHNKVRVIPLCPSRPLAIGIIGNSRLALRSAINLGFSDTVCHPALEGLFPHPHEGSH